ncbi:MAG: hypothetical protein HOP30_16350 [Cyclobacteriaceae bacterium]|nr:hypothetical protein [Cyclobacteriaceae bacterium]
MWQSDPVRAIKFCDSLLAKSESDKNIHLTIIGHFLYVSGVNDINTVEKHLSKASFLVKEKLNDSTSQLLEGYIEYLWSYYFLYKKSHWAIALQHLYKAELLLEKHPSLILLKKVKIQLGNLSYNCSQYNVTIKECFELIDNKKLYQLTDKELMLLYNVIGLAYSNQGMFDKARFYFNSAFQHIKGGENYTRFWRTLIQTNLAKEYRLKKEYANYIPLFKEDVSNCKSIGDYEGILWSYLNLARANLAANHFKESSQYLDSINYISDTKKLEIHSEAILAMNSIAIQIDLATRDYSQLSQKFGRLNLMNDTVVRALNRRMGETSQLIAKSSIMQDEFTRNNIQLQKIEFQKREQRNLAIFIVLIILGAFFSIYFWLSRRNLKKTLRLNYELNQAQELKIKMEAELLETKSELDKLSDEIEIKKKQLVSHSLSMVQKNETLNEIRAAIKKIRNLQSDSSSLKDVISGMMSSVNQNFQMDNEWELFRIQFEEVDPGFFTALRTKFPELSETDLRFCALFKLNLNSSQVAGLLNITAESVKAARHRLRKKMKLKPNHNIHEFLNNEFK